MEKPIVTALAAYGMSGEVFHAPLLSVNPLFNLKIIRERSKNRSLERYKNIKIVRSFDELINDKEVELVVINTPDNLHYEQSKQALLAGKHVVVEKPFVLKSAQGSELIQIARDKNLVLTIFQNRRWDGDFMTVKQIMDNNLIGRVVEFDSHFDRFRNFIRKSWKEDASYGSGTVYNLGSHLIDQAVVLFGMPQTITADIATLRTGGSVDDFFNIWLGYENIKVSLKATYLAKQPNARFTLHGNDGSFVKYGVDPQEADLKTGRLPDDYQWGSEPESRWGILNAEFNGLHFKGKIQTLAGNYQAFYNNVFQAVRHGKALAVHPSEANNVIRIIEAAFKSHKTGSAVQLSE